ncbi:MAG: fumarylacetoacetase [Phycisphaerales bacterium]|nr:fumarylacetoacetase [Phycisphaerales bacterium]
MMPSLRSFLEVDPASHFPIQNIPFGVFRRKTGSDRGTIGTAIGEYVVDLHALEQAGLLRLSSLSGATVFDRSTLNAFMSAGRSAWTEARSALQRLLSADEPALRDHRRLRDQAIVPMSEVEMLLPCEIGDYTDFYSSRQHATNVGIMFRGKENALMPNWLYLPVAYHGRSSSIVISGTDLHRPRGQTKADDAPAPSFGPSRNVDFELEMGFFVGPGNPLGQPIPTSAAREHIFGLVLVNDWSARDIQKWEYVPLGPFLAKNFGTSISPWIVTLDALEPFRVAGEPQSPPPLPYLQCPEPFSFDIKLEVSLQTSEMSRPQVICRSNFRHLYWNMAQQLAHHTSNGCNLRPGDLLASGTISGPTPDSFGSLLELAWMRQRPLQLPDGQTRVAVEDGDRITMTGWCEGDGYRIGFGEVTGRILPALG